MRNKTKFCLGLLILFCLFSISCVKSYRGEFIPLRKARGNTEEEQLAAYYDSFRFIALRWDESKNKFEVSFRKLTLAQLQKQLDERLKDFEYALDYKNEDWAKFIEYFKLRPEYERKEELLKLNRDRVRVARIDNEFRKLMGIRSGSSSYDVDGNGYGGQDPYERVDIKKIYTPKDLKLEFPFESPTVNEARANGNLKLIEEFVWVTNQTYGKKEPDPGAPKDQNKFIWKPIKRSIHFKSYKIIGATTDKPRDNEIDYIEGFRIKNDKGELEYKPALKLFVHNYQAVLVVDQDQEHELGFGLPEIVAGLYKVVSAGALMDPTLIAGLYPEKPEQRRIPPPKKPDIQIVIAPVGKPADLWEKATDAAGWKVPSYKNNRGDNYDVKVKFVRYKKDVDPESPEARYKQIEHIMKIYRDRSRTVEYLKPKPPFNNRDLVKVEDGLGDGKKIKVEFANGDEKQGNVAPGANIFTDDKPEKIAYDEGDIRFVLWDKDGDGKFELKMEVAKDTNTGQETMGEANGGGEHIHVQPDFKEILKQKN